MYPRPRVALLTTGSEIVEPYQPLQPGQIRNSNRYSLIGQINACGALVDRALHVADTVSAVGGALQDLRDADAIITSGGVSVGDYDFVRVVLEQQGNVLFEKVAQRPGKPLIFGMLNGKPLFGLPGYPTSSMVCFEIYVRPALLKMAGETELERPKVMARLTESVKQRPGFTQFVRVVVSAGPEGYSATPLATQKSGALRSMLGANGLLVVPADRERAEVGDSFETLLLAPVVAGQPG